MVILQKIRKRCFCSQRACLKRRWSLQGSFYGIAKKKMSHGFFSISFFFDVKDPYFRWSLIIFTVITWGQHTAILTQGMGSTQHPAKSRLVESNPPAQTRCPGRFPVPYCCLRSAETIQTAEIHPGFVFCGNSRCFFLQGKLRSIQRIASSEWMISTTKHVWLDLDNNTTKNNTLWRVSSILSFTLGSSSSSSELHALGHERTPQWQRLDRMKEKTDPSHKMLHTKPRCFWNVQTKKKQGNKNHPKTPFNHVFIISSMCFKKNPFDSLSISKNASKNLPEFVGLHQMLASKILRWFSSAWKAFHLGPKRWSSFHEVHGDSLKKGKLSLSIHGTLGRTVPWASTTIKIMGDTIPMIKTLR